jgi:hypothetical protein
LSSGPYHSAAFSGREHRRGQCPDLSPLVRFIIGSNLNFQKGKAMKIVVPDVDGRTVLGDIWHDVVDSETGKTVGHVRGHQGSQFFDNKSWQIELFDKQHRAEFDRLSECRAFAKGVESAINSLMPEKKASAKKVA